MFKPEAEFRMTYLMLDQVALASEQCIVFFGAAVSVFELEFIRRRVEHFLDVRPAHASNGEYCTTAIIPPFRTMAFAMALQSVHF